MRDIVGSVSICVEKGLKKKLDDLIKIIGMNSFDKDNFASWISGTENFERNKSDQCKAILKNDGFFRTPVSIDGMKGTQVTIMYWKDIVEVLWKQVDLWE